MLFLLTESIQIFTFPFSALAGFSELDVQFGELPFIF